MQATLDPSFRLHVWAQFAAAALTRGVSTSQAAHGADKMLAEFDKRAETVLAEENARLDATMARVDVLVEEIKREQGTGAFLNDLAKGEGEDGRLDG